MVIFMKYSTQIFLIMTLVAFVISGCSQESNTDIIDVADDKSVGTFALPDTIQTTAINPNNISAYIVIDNGNGSPRREPMSIINNTVQFTTHLSPGTYSFTIEFKYSDTEFSDITLASAFKTDIAISTGANTNVAYQASDYSYPDDDVDGIYNIIELEQGNDPTDVNNKPPLTCSVAQGVINCVPNGYTISVAVFGLQGTGLTLQNNGEDSLNIEAEGTFTFQSPLTDGSDYNVTVANQPTNPSQNCAVSNGSGTVNGTDIIAVNIDCITNTYSIGGSVSGLVGSGLSIQLNETTLNISSASASYIFPDSLTDGTDYIVTIANQPINPSQTCNVVNGGGTLAGFDVSDVDIVCATNAYFVSGMVNGLFGNGLELQINNAETTTINPDNTFVFPTALIDGSDYSVSVVTPPSNPSQTCTVNNATGVVSSAEVSDIVVNCQTNSFTIGGTLTALEGTGLILQNNGVDSLNIEPGAQDNSFVFPSALTDGSTYNVTVLAQPSVPDQTCEISNGSGIVNGTNVTGIQCCCKRADSTLIVNSDTVFDPITNLTWKRDWEPNNYTWAQAVDRCQIQGLRLPTVAELESIVDARFSPTWMPCTFRGDGLSAWSSTTVGTQSAFIVHFNFGGTGNDIQQNRYSVRCVSGP